MESQTGANCSRSMTASGWLGKTPAPPTPEILRGHSKSRQHLTPLRLFFQFNNTTVEATQSGQLSNAAKDKKRGADGRTDRIDLDLHHRSARPASTSFSTMSIVELPNRFESASKSCPCASRKARTKIPNETASKHAILIPPRQRHGSPNCLLSPDRRPKAAKARRSCNSRLPDGKIDKPPPNPSVHSYNSRSYER